MVRVPIEEFLSRIGVRAFSDTDMSKSLNRLPSISSDGPWLAGGYIRRTLTNQKLDSDLDFFFRNEEQLKEFALGLEDRGATKVKENDKNQMYVLPSKIGVLDDEKKIHLPELNIQLINFRYYDSMDAVLDSFDFTLCQFGFDGQYISMNEFALWDTARKQIVPHKVSFGVATLRRLIKYTNQGYTACGGCLTEILNQVVENPAIINSDILYID